MVNPNGPRVFSQSKPDILLYVAAMVYDQEFGPHDDEKSKTTGEEEDKQMIMEAKIFGDKVPRKNRVRRSPSSRKTTVTPWTRVIEQQRSVLQSPNPESELQNPNASESEPWSSSCVTLMFKKRRRHDDDQINTEEIVSRKKLRIVRPLEIEAEPIQTSPPDWLLRVMRREGDGYNPKLISTRKLYKTDLDKIQGRLSVPFKQVKNPNFLREEETRIIHEQAVKIRKEGVSVDLVDPQMKKHALELRKWKMSGNWNYVFVVGWNDVVAANGFQVDDFFPLWSFRSGTGKLCFALVPKSSHGGDGASTSGCSSFDESLHL